MQTSGSTWYFAADGERHGPRTLDEMRALLADGTIAGDTPVWTHGLAEWAPASAFPLLLEAPEPAAPPVPPALPAPEPPPAPTEGIPPAMFAWRRFFARWFDTITLMMVGFAAAGYTTPERLAAVSPLVMLGAPLGTLVVQALCLAATGSTPGKALVGLRLRTPGGGFPPLGAALVRELYVWALGMGMGLSFVMPVTHAFSYYRVTRRGATPWDERLGLRLEVGPIGPFRLVFLAMLVFLVLIGAIGSAQLLAGS